MADRDVKELIERIMEEARGHQSAQFSTKVYGDEPIIKTGRQMANFLPDRYREMRTISRWQEDPKGGAGRWLSEAELFYRQGLFMADFEDDCPYRGTFKSYFPTYNAMSDRQLRGYFTWRAQVRRGHVEETSTSFAFVYLYELICGIGVTDPREGFDQIKSFWEAYRVFEPGIDRFARVWLQDYAVYHGLDSKLLADTRSVAFDRAVVELKRAYRDALPAGAPSAEKGKRRKKAAEPALPPPADEEREERLFKAIDALSTYRLAESRTNRDHHADLRHVAGAVYVRMARYYDTHRKSGIIPSLFGEETAMPYTMFGSAVFFAPERHADCEYKLDPIHFYRCTNGYWECTRIHGSRSKSTKLGQMMRACDQRLRLALGSKHPLKEEEVPKYLAKIIDEEIDAWIAWNEAHKPVKIDIDLSSLDSIRSAAAQTREALLIDEEREGYERRGTSEEEAAATDAGGIDVPGPLAEPVDANDGTGSKESAIDPGPARPPLEKAAPRNGVEGAIDSPAAQTPPPPAPGAPGLVEGGAVPLDPHQQAYLAALLDRDAAAAVSALAASGMGEDMLVDAINEALFDRIGDTVIEFGAQGPELIEDYEEDVRGIIGHE